MKKFSKILCAVLLVALIVSTVAIIVSADTPTPTMTVTPTTQASADVTAMLEATKSTADGNLLTSLAWVASGNSTVPTDLMKSYIVDVDGDKFVGLHAPATKTGIHMQYTMSTDNAKMIPMSNQHFYVIELDIASQSTLPTLLEIAIVNRNSGGSGTDMMGAAVVLGNYVGDITSGQWKHVTIVGQIDLVLGEDGKPVEAESVNHQHIFVDGKYVGTQKGAVNYNAVMGGTTPESYNNGSGLYAQGIKVEVPGSGTVNAGESAMFDNLYRHDMTKAEAESNGLAAIVAAKSDISAWANYPTTAKSGQKLPAFVKIDGVEYNNAAAASAILTGNETHEVEFIGENIAAVTVSTDATVKTNGFNVQYGSVTGAKINEVANGVFEIRTPNTTLTPTTSGSSIIPVIKYDAPDNLFVTVAQQQMYADSNSKDFLQQYITNVKGDDNPYVSHIITDTITITPENNANYGGAAQSAGYSQIHIHTNFEIGDPGATSGGYTLGAVGVRPAGMYVVFEWDMYSNTNMPYGMYVGNTFRNASNQNKAGVNIQLDDYQGATHIGDSLPQGEWYHFTMIGSLDTNELHIYINNQYVTTQKNGVANNITELNNGGKIWGPRLNLYYRSTNAKNTVTHLKGDMFAVDNYYGRVLTGDEAGNLADYFGTESLAGWDKNVYDENYGAENYPIALPVAELDGETYYSIAKIDAKLTGRESHTLNLIGDLPGVLQVNSNLVVNTNGYEFVEGKNFIAPTGSTITANGNTVSIVVPFTENIQYTTLNSGTKGSLGLAVSNVAGNIVDAAGTWAPNNAVGSDPLLIFKQAENENGDKYLTVFPSDLVIGGNYDKNPYGYFENYNIKDDSNRMDANSYYVIDIDVYTESEWIAGVALAPTIRNAPTGGGFPFGSPVTFGDVLEVGGGWRHITYIGDIGANKAYVFVDGVYVTTLHHAWEVGKGNTPEQGLYATGFRLDLPVGKPIEADQMMGFRGISERVYKTNEAAGDIASAIAAGNLNGWVNNIVGYQGEATAIAQIDGVDYSDIASASAALATGGSHTVEFLHDFLGEITTSDAAILNAHGFGELKINPVMAEIDDGVYVAQALIKQGNEYIKLTIDNVADFAVPAYWYESADADDATEVIYFPVGSTVSYLTHNIYIPNNFIVNGILYNGGWCDGNLADDVFVTEWPTITADDVAGGSEFYYYIHNTEEATDITIKSDMKYNLSLYADFDVNVFVKDANGTYTIDGATYTKYTKGIAANNLASDITFDIEFVVDGVTYTERVTVNVLNYATTVLNKADVSDQMKRVMMSALDYANEAYGLVSGNTNAQIEAILNNHAYAQYVVEANTEYGPANMYDLSAILSGIQLQLDSNVAFVLKVANGFTGTLTISYNDYKGQAWSNTYTVEEGQQYIVLDDLKVYNLDAIFTISGNGVSGQYNLGQYIKHLVENNIDADFAEALFTYAKVAQAYKLALNNAQ